VDMSRTGARTEVAQWLSYSDLSARARAEAEQEIKTIAAAVADHLRLPKSARADIARQVRQVTFRITTHYPGVDDKLIERMEAALLAAGSQLLFPPRVFKAS
jgi:hypothetical protein